MHGKIVRDPIHEYISFSEEERRLIDSPWFQRLRYCSQNGPTRLVYPSILGTRFEHSLGVMELASRFLDSVLDVEKYENPEVVSNFIQICKRDLNLFLGIDTDKKKDKEVVADVRRILRITALCHDLGHFPLSHTLERAFEHEFMPKPIPTTHEGIPTYGAIPTHNPRRVCHELLSVELVRYILEKQDAAIEDWVARAVILVMLAPEKLSVKHEGGDVVCSQTMFHTLNGIIMGDYDADRLDYLQRDGYLSGSGFGHFDVRRFIDAMMLTQEKGVYRVIPSSHALSTIEACLIERYKLYKWVYLHHKTLFFDEVCCEVARKLFRDEEIIKQLFIEYKGDVTKDYLRRILDSLGSPNSKIPPLILFNGRILGLEDGYYQLRAEFFVKNKESYFFDDVWFCRECRNKERFGSLRKFYVQTLIERQPCGMTLWKDWSQFKDFRDLCVQKTINSEAFESKVPKLEFKEKNIHRFLKNLWRLMRDGDFPEVVRLKTIEETAEGLKTAEIGQIRPLLRIADWELFGDLTKKEIIGRTGDPDYLFTHSALLREVSGLREEIPFYMFVAGGVEDVKQAKKNLENLLTITAEAFINSLIVYWDNGNVGDIKEITAEWKQAVTQEIREGN